MTDANGDAHVTVNLHSLMGDYIGIGNRQKLKDLIREHLDRGVRIFVLDFSQIKYIDPVGLDMLHTVQKLIRRSEGELELINMREDMRTMFRETILDANFLIREE